MMIEPGKLSGYAFAVVGITTLTALFFGVAATMVAAGLYEIGYASTDPHRWGLTAFLVSGALSFAITVVKAYRDYHFEPYAGNETAKCGSTGDRNDTPD